MGEIRAGIRANDRGGVIQPAARPGDVLVRSKRAHAVGRRFDLRIEKRPDVSNTGSPEVGRPAWEIRASTEAEPHVLRDVESRKQHTRAKYSVSFLLMAIPVFGAVAFTKPRRMGGTYEFRSYGAHARHFSALRRRWVARFRERHIGRKMIDPQRPLPHWSHNPRIMRRT